MIGRCARRPDHSQGFILVIALVFTTLLAVGSILAVGGTLSALQSASRQLRDKRAFLEADGAAALCKAELRNRLQTALTAQMRSVANIAAITPYVPNDPAGMLAQYAFKSGESLPNVRFTRDSGTQAHLDITYQPAGAASPYTCTLTVISRVPPANINTGSGPPVYYFRYAYTIVARVADGDVSRQVALQGTFAITLQNDNFARYALFTDLQTYAGNPVWFTNRTKFYGPVHTNGKFNFANNPGPLFTEVVTSVNGEAYYYNAVGNPPVSYPISLDDDHNGVRDLPAFDGGFMRGVENIPMPLGTSANRQLEKALGLSEGALGQGVLEPNPLSLSTGVHLGTSAGNMTGGIYVNSGTNGGGNPVSVSLSGGSTAQYAVAIADRLWRVTVNPGTQRTSLVTPGGLTTTYGGVPNGMFFVNGQVASLGGTVQRDTQVTIAATSDVILTNNLAYENYASGETPSAEGYTNLLGLMSWNGDVRIGTAAPNDISVHATIMTPTGEFRVDNHNSGYSRGIATILGGVIEHTYGRFGTFGNSTTGYGRRFLYDARMRKGMSPPFFPTIARVITTVSGLNDRPNWQQTE